MEARASPLKPNVVMSLRSSAVAILDVACLSKHSTASSGVIPHPLSITWINVLPASVRITDTCVAPASTAFSINSLTTEAGLCTTSPAAIILAMLPGNMRMSILQQGVELGDVNHCYEKQDQAYYADDGLGLGSASLAAVVAVPEGSLEI